MQGKHQKRRVVASIVGAVMVSAWAIPGAALGTDRTVGSCSAQAPENTCMAQAFMRNKPKAIVIHGSVSPDQAFRVPYRVFCQGGGGEIAFATQGQVNGSQSITHVVHIPRRRRTHHCSAQAAIVLRGPAQGSATLTLKERI